MRISIDRLPGRYMPVLVDGNIKQMRDKATLQADAVALLRETGPLPKKKIITALRTVKWLVDEVMEKAEADGEVERFRMRSARGRMDEYWCVAGRAPIRSRYNLRGAEILAGFQTAIVKKQLEARHGHG